MIAGYKSESSHPNPERRRPHVEPDALRNASLGILTAVLTLTFYWMLVVGDDSSFKLTITFLICTVFLSGFFILFGESPIEVGAKSAMILFLGFLFLHTFRASWCFAP